MSVEDETPKDITITRGYACAAILLFMFMTVAELLGYGVIL
jgi:hypothetical protein